MTYTYFEIIELAIDKPHLYLRESNIFCLYDYLQGYWQGSDRNNDAEQCSILQKWFELKFGGTGYFGGGQCWAVILYNFAGNNGEEALVIFSKLWKEFKLEREILKKTQNKS